MTLLDRLKPALRSAWLPLALLLIALSTVFVFGGDRGYFYRPANSHNWISAHHVGLAVNISPERGFQRFARRLIDDDGIIRYRPYNRFPIGGYLSMKLATMPFEWSPSVRLYAARVLMLLFFTAAAVLAYLSLCRLVSNRWIALTATLLSFSSYHLLYFNDMTANEAMPDLFGVMLTFHGMVVFVQEGRFRQLLVKTCIALLMGWHVLALLLPFVIFGLVIEILRARSADAASPHALTPLHRGKHAALALLRSRFLLLGGIAFGLSLALLTFNFTMEYILLDGETPLTELTSFQSMLARSGADSSFNSSFAADRAWRPFLEGQFQSIFRMFLPYSLYGLVGFRDDAAGHPTRVFQGSAEAPTMIVRNYQGVGLGAILTAAGLIGSIFVRPRILFATLASFGFFWAVPMRNTTYAHEFEAIYYIGLPLVFFTLILLLARRLTNRDGVVVAASVLALLLFAVSSFQMSHVGYNAETARVTKAADEDFRVIREMTADELVTVLHIGGSYEYFFPWAGYALKAMTYYLNTSFIRYRYLPAVEGGLVVMRERIDTDALLTPQNKHFFLYDRAGLEAWYGARYRTIASGQPLASGEFDVYLIDGTVYYLKEPCDRADDAGRLFLHVYPIDKDDLSRSHKPAGFQSIDFGLVERGLIFDGKCLASVQLPQYDIAKFSVGQVGDDAWGAPFVVAGPILNSIVSTEPVARAEFDLYIDGGKLYYVKEPCGEEDIATRFFMHVVPEDVDDLPDKRKQYGFDNLDFDFGDHGVLFDDNCLAGVYLPQYSTVSVSTGQFDATGRIWGVEIIPDARE